MKLALSIIFLSVAASSTAQSLIANYQVTRAFSLSRGTSNDANELELSFEGALYTKGNKTISFCRPLYLNEYPTGTVDSDVPGQGIVTTYLFMDSIQALNYVNLDSMIWRSRNDRSGSNRPRTNILREFETGSQKWHLLAETKVISGLSCQKAVVYRNGNSGEIVYEIWFCPNIDQLVGPRGLRDVPGLVVELTVVPFKEHWSLQSYVENAPVNDQLFWPKEFDQPFRKMAKLRRIE